MPSAPGSPHPQRSARDSLERLYALWMISTLLLLLGMVVVVFLFSGKLAALSDRIDDQNERLATLNRSVLQVQTADPRGALPAADSPVDSAVTRPATPARPTTRRAQPASRPTSTAARGAGPTPAMEDAQLAARLDDVLRGAVHPDQASVDPQAADNLLDEALGQAERADWRGANLARLALVAHLRERDADAERLLERAASVGESGGAYFDFVARRMLSLGRVDRAVESARRWRAMDRADARAAVLLAETCAAADDYECAHAVLDELVAADGLSVEDRLRAARVCVALERWRDLARMLEGLGAIEAELTGERDLLRGIRLIQDGRLTEALSVLDYLADIRPDDVEVLLWRGVVLLGANQVDAARDAFAAVTTRAPRKREAWFWSAMHALRIDDVDRARELLDTVIAMAPRYPAAWEARGIVELNAGEPAAAIERLSQATSVDPRRASAHFLMALAGAKLGQRETAEAALRRALELDPALLNQAAAAEALMRLFPTAEMDAMAGEGAASAPATQPVEARGDE